MSLSTWSFFGWMSQGGHSEPLLHVALFYQSTPSCLKVRGGLGGVGGPCGPLCQPQSKELGLGDYQSWSGLLGQDLGTVTVGTGDSDLTIIMTRLAV